MWRVLLALGAACAAARANQDVVRTFVDPVTSPASLFDHLVVDRNTGRVYVGAVNRIYQLSPDLEVAQWIVTGPVNDSAQCTFDCPSNFIKKPTDNVNKALVIDYATSRLITCGSVLQGLCSVRNLNNISHDVREVREPVVANNATSSTVAFIAPGPPNPPMTQVMYVGVTFTGNSPYRSEVPAVSSRSLEDDRLFMIARTAVTTGTRMFVNSLSRERYPINYVYGFSSEGFSYFLTTQLRGVGSDTYYSKLVRVCHDDENYYSYTEIPMSCMGEGGGNFGYNLVQAAFVGKAGSVLAGELGITAQHDVLFAAFSQSETINSNKPSNVSALCVYSLKAIRRKFMQNIKTCFSGNGSRGLDFISPSHACVGTKLLPSSEDFCGLDVNTPLGGEQPVEAVPVAVFTKRLTAVAATAIGDYTVVFAGTAEGHLKKIVVESSSSAFEYGDIVVDKGSSVNKDLFFDTQLMHLYVMTERKVSKVKVQECSVHKSCLTCLGAKDPYCGWCSLKNKCSLRSDCQDAAKDPLYWNSYRSGRCTIIIQVTPNQLQRTTARTLDLLIENLPTLNGQFLCAFTALDRTLITNATRKPYGVNCTTPRTDTLPSIPTGQHHFTAKLSVRTTQGPDFVATNFTFFDCNTYSSCTQCVSSSFPCDWCVDGHRCTHDTAENCRNDILVTGISRIGPSYRSGPGFCPTINSTSDGTNEILVPSGVRKAIKVKVHIIGQFIVQTRFVCQFNIEGRVIHVNAQLLAHTIYCEGVEFTYTSRASNITASFNVLWGGSKPLDNPDNTHILIYRCNDMADNCGMCLALPEKFGCGWCPGSDKCEVQEQCSALSVWLNRTQTCPNPEIHSFSPQLGPWDGGTNITIEGINLGRNISDIYNGVTIAGIKCQPIIELYVKTKQIVCTVDGTGREVPRDGPVVVRVADYRGESTHHYAFVSPRIKSIHPKYGPQSGGTKLRITGEYLNAGSNIQAFIDESPCAILFVSHEEAVCRTSHSYQLKMGTLRMHFDNGMRILDREKFEYIEDPVILSVESGPPLINQRKQPKGIPSGGIKIKVMGMNFHSIQFPQIYVYYDNQRYTAPCHRVDFQTQLICESPGIKSACLNLYSDRPLVLEYGFNMDNVQSVQNLTSKMGEGFLLYPDPIYEKFVEDVKYYESEYLTIKGQNLDKACAEVDIEVHIGERFCNVTSLSQHELTCRPPAPDELPDGVHTLEVKVKVGRALTYNIGKLSYSNIRKLTKVKAQECNMYKSCLTCLGAKDVYCGWCSLENKCSFRSDCRDAAKDPLYWSSYLSGSCTTITQVTPNQLQRTTARTLDLLIENLPTLNGQFLCAFTALDRTLITNATRKPYGVNCSTPRTDTLPSIPTGQHHFTAKLSVRTTQGPDFVATNFTFFDCNTYSSCTQCVSSPFPCDWCVVGHRCTHDTAENCRNDILVTGVSRIGPSFRSGPGFCPTMNSTSDGTNEILVPSGVKKAIKVKVHIIGQFIVQTRFVCQFNIEGRVIHVNAQLLAHTIYCEGVEFTYTSRASNITASFTVLWGGSKPLDNPDNIHILMYRCSDMADNCGMCLALSEKFRCGWCQGSDKCEIQQQCGAFSVWLNRTQTCPNPEIHSFKPQLGPWNGGTNITIEGINLGRNISDIYNGVTIAGIKCQPIIELYVKTKQIVCTVDGPGEEVPRDGPVVVRVADYRGESTHHYAFVNPRINSIQPKYGPQSGGTKLRITGEYLNAGSNIQAFIDELPCAILSVSHEEAVCRTSHSYQLKMGTLRMRFDNGMRTLDREKFEYIEDPVILSVESGPPLISQRKQPKGISSGGIKIKVMGMNFHSIQFPQIYVYHDNQRYTAPCHRVDFQTQLICESPGIKSACLNLYSDRPLVLEYGFNMDNVQSVQNLTSKMGKGFLLYPDPLYEKFVEDVKYYESEYLTIKGQNLDLACAVGDIEVLNGERFCNVTSLSQHELTCRPPAPDELPDGVDTLEVKVKVGRALTYNIGKLSYSNIRKVTKVNAQECNVYKSCLTCLGAKDVYCGWCSLENKCSLRSDCQDAAKDPLYWSSYLSGSCTTITQVTPNQLQRTTARTLDLLIENLPTLNGQFLCAFAFLDRTLITNATRKPYGVNCSTPRTDTLPSIPTGQHHFTAKLSVRTTQGQDFVATNFTFFDCNTYSSCTQCVSSSFPCDWCVDGHRCTHDTAENCRNDILVTGVSRIGPSYRSGPGFCPTINSTSDGTNEILVPSGVKKAIKVKVHIIGQFIVQTRFVCQFNIEGRVTHVNAQLLADTIYCEAVEFTYTSRAPNITASFAVIWGGSKPLDNPDNTHILIYRCNDMADNCGMCLALPEKFGCGWCQGSDKCEVQEQCGASSVWLNRIKTSICPG